MRAIILASGSKANATYLEINGSKVLIDCGLSYRQIVQRLNERGKNLDGLEAVFITHEHMDHVAGLRVLAKNHNLKIILSKGTYDNLDKRFYGDILPEMFVITSDLQQLDFGNYSVLPFNTYHDASEPLGYKFIEQEKTLVYLTDTGYFPIKSLKELKNSDCYIIEANHEVELLLESARPWMLKKRILDDQGHLSNEDSASLVINLLGERTKQIILAHLSLECNYEEIALKTYEKVFYNEGIDILSYKIITAKQNHSTEEIIIE